MPKNKDFGFQLPKKIQQEKTSEAKIQKELEAHFGIQRFRTSAGFAATLEN